ncbi:hypothetical protein PYW08_015407 [Mythimna loreyi]|uniref:Uncharacterized protein n=1 Tax=Mythimna loreyi TaxID=667449 RepID=A0ACC2QVK0_9NEOP|nr:hypothetical protein PYW08_015407 [Mythimna loreyi]
MYTGRILQVGTDGQSLKCEEHQKKKSQRSLESEKYRHAAYKQACSMQAGMQHASRHAACNLACSMQRASFLSRLRRCRVWAAPRELIVADGFNAHQFGHVNVLPINSYAKYFFMP